MEADENLNPTHHELFVRAIVLRGLHAEFDII